MWNCKLENPVQRWRWCPAVTFGKIWFQTRPSLARSLLDRWWKGDSNWEKNGRPLSHTSSRLNSHSLFCCCSRQGQGGHKWGWKKQYCLSRQRKIKHCTWICGSPAVVATACPFYNTHMHTSAWLPSIDIFLFLRLSCLAFTQFLEHWKKCARLTILWRQKQSVIFFKAAESRGDFWQWFGDKINASR